MPDDEEDPRHDPGAALAAIKAIHAAGGRALSGDEATEFLTRPIYMGTPKAPDKETGARGPKNTKTQYDRALDRRRDLYRKLVKLPGLGRAAGWEARPEYVATLRAALADKTVPARLKAHDVLARLARAGQPAPTERTVRRHLAASKDITPGN